MPEIDAVTPPSTSKTRLFPPALTVTPAAGPVIVCFPPVSASSSWLPLSLIVCGVLNGGWIEDERLLCCFLALAWLMKERRSPELVGTAPRIPHRLLTVNWTVGRGLEHLQDWRRRSLVVYRLGGVCKSLFKICDGWPWMSPPRVGFPALRFDAIKRGPGRGQETRAHNGAIPETPARMADVPAPTRGRDRALDD